MDPFKEAQQTQSRLRALDKSERKTIGNVKRRYAAKRNHLLANVSGRARKLLELVTEPVEQTEKTTHMPGDSEPPEADDVGEATPEMVAAHSGQLSARLLAPVPDAPKPIEGPAEKASRHAR